MAPNMEEYERLKEEMGDDFYPGVNSLVHGGKGRVSKTALDKMSVDLEQQCVCSGLWCECLSNMHCSCYFFIDDLFLHFLKELVVNVNCL